MSRLTKVKIVRIDEEMNVALEQYVKDNPSIKNKSALVREGIKLVLASDQPKIKAAFIDELIAWRTEMHRIGVNLNQLDYRLNANHPVSTEDVRQVQKELKKEFHGLAMKFRNIENAIKRA